MDRREFFCTLSLAVMGASGSSCRSLAAGSRKGLPPNIVIIFADDLGYGDLSCYGHPTLRTPNLDRMASEGAKMTQFYSAAPVCTPSRAALLTGRLPIRSGMCSSKRRVLFPDSAGGLPEEEITIAAALRTAGYATACIGKWHLGHLPRFLPTRRGFDYYYGIPYSNDMKPCPLMENETVLEEPAEQTTLTRRYTDKAVGFIEENKDRPFFLYFPHTFPHVPLFASKHFKDTSLRGLYGDVVEELDWSVGRILETLRETGLSDNTLVLFTSDNGPWLTKKLNGGSAGLLRGGKGSTWEGGVREPFLAWWPGRIMPGTVRTEVGSTMDLFATALSCGKVPLPEDRVIDGVNLLPLLLGKGQATTGERTLFYYRGVEIFAVRKGPWKAHFTTQDGYGDKPKAHETPRLYHLEHDPSEKYDVGNEYPEILDDIMREVERHRAQLKPVKPQLETKIEKTEE